MPAIALLAVGLLLVGYVAIDSYRSSVRRVQDSRLGAPYALEHYMVLSCIREQMAVAVDQDETLFVELPLGVPIGDVFWTQRLNELASPERMVVSTAEDASAIVQVVAPGTEFGRMPRFVAQCGSPNFVTVEVVVFDAP